MFEEADWSLVLDGRSLRLCLSPALCHLEAGRMMASSRRTWSERIAWSRIDSKLYTEMVEKGRSRVSRSGWAK